jgi:tetratricopeptide (TPR) repeat protein
MARVALPDDVDPRELDPESRRQLTSLVKETADLVARHLIMAGRLLEEDPEQALAHARAARALGGRVGVVREANGLVAYAAGEWTEALSELRTARRITGEPDHLPVMADCERALGRPDRALAVAEDPQVARLAPAARVEMMIVVSGARRDMGQPEAAAVALNVSALEGPVRPWTARLRYAYADALLECGREDEARSWFARAAEVDELGETDADDRVLELDGVVFEDHEAADEDSEDEAPEDRTDAAVDSRTEPSSAVDESTTATSSQVSGDVGGEPAGQGGELRLFD